MINGRETGLQRILDLKTGLAAGRKGKEKVDWE